MNFEKKINFDENSDQNVKFCLQFRLDQNCDLWKKFGTLTKISIHHQNFEWHHF